MNKGIIGVSCNNAYICQSVYAAVGLCVLWGKKV